jgi:hypothetical protein
MRNDRGMMNDDKPTISITLSPAQVDQVVRAASQGRAPSLAAVVSNLLARPHAPEDGASNGAAKGASEQEASFGGYMPRDVGDPRLSRSLLRGLSLLTRFGPDGGERGIVELAGDLGMSPSTAHRYASTLVELGLLERCPKTRKYRLPGMASPGAP